MGSDEFSHFFRVFFVFLRFFVSFFAFLRFSSFFFVFLRFPLIVRGHGETTAIYCKIGNFNPTPSAATPCC